MTRRKTRRLLRRTARQVRDTKSSAFGYPHCVYRSRFSLRDYIRWAAGIPGHYPEREDDFAPCVHMRDARRGRIHTHARTP